MSFLLCESASTFVAQNHVAANLNTLKFISPPSVNDNIVPLLSLIVLDAFVKPELLFAERALLTGFHPAPDREQVPHLAALLSAAVPKTFAMGPGGSAEGTCFRRVAWGGGVKVMYQHLLGAVRRLSAALLREITIREFDPPNPYLYLSLPPALAGGADNSSSPLSAVTAAATRTANTTRNVAAVRNGRRLPMAKESKRKEQKLQSHRQQGGDAQVSSAAKKAGLYLTNELTQLDDSFIETLSVPTAENATSVRIGFGVGTGPRQARRALNVVIYTRGSSGVGRTIQGEELLRDRLIALGARATICCDFRKISLAEQLGYAIHADAIVGLHGAGLINNLFAPAGAITVELKTIYGYGLTLFAVSSEARQGSFIEINIKDYHIWGKPGQSRNKPVDEPLMGRISEALFSVLRSTKSLENAQEHKVFSDRHKPGGPEETEKLLSTARAELELLVNKNFQHELFLPLTSTPALPRPRGDIVMLSYPTSAFETAMAALAAAERAEQDTPSNPSTRTSSMSSVGASSSASASALDFLFHILGPEVQEAHAQCARLVVSGYWEHLQIGLKDVHERYCIACDLSLLSTQRSVLSPPTPQLSPPTKPGHNDAHPSAKRNIRGSAKADLPKNEMRPTTAQDVGVQLLKALPPPPAARNQYQQHQHQQLIDGLLQGARSGQQKKQNQHRSQHNQHHRDQLPA